MDRQRGVAAVRFFSPPTRKKSAKLLVQSISYQVWQRRRVLLVLLVLLDCSCGRNRLLFVGAHLIYLDWHWREIIVASRPDRGRVSYSFEQVEECWHGPVEAAMVCSVPPGLGFVLWGEPLRQHRCSRDP